MNAEWTGIASLDASLITLGLVERRAGDGESVVWRPHPGPFTPEARKASVDVLVDPTPFLDPTKKVGS